eukprot:5682049-Prymnesium_polylepis.1
MQGEARRVRVARAHDLRRDVELFADVGAKVLQQPERVDGDGDDGRTLGARRRGRERSIVWGAGDSRISAVKFAAAPRYLEVAEPKHEAHAEHQDGEVERDEAAAKVAERALVLLLHVPHRHDHAALRSAQRHAGARHRDGRRHEQHDE